MRPRKRALSKDLHKGKTVTSRTGPILPDRRSLPRGFGYFPRLLDRRAQGALLAEIRAVIAAAPFYRPAMPGTGKPFSVSMTNCGALGWVSDKAGGYRYERLHPMTGEPWPAMPGQITQIWRAVAAYEAQPQACLINHYGAGAKMGDHRDADEADASAPVVSISLGDTARFRLGGLRRRDQVTSFDLVSGDVVVLGGPARLAYHGIARIFPESSDLLAEGGRFNLTLRRVTEPD